ncbi:VacB/RNase II family 3'-5' exoribonuclease [Pseudomonas taiwanensis]|uniref:VacB/RNase II family 3'-5' exoribonuclease n=1 Tax=Pseudomonas taiwanensis TaxID=470150 RepID=UPI0028E0928C|nr:VacB/RNase II family 3'-5' exoribonuclease [Pseudomonas taiwanensis]MDT8925393.1 VacB/RNase II family 3'-5' exoribonuclease [Pseudomonas taiwanensis]
MFKGNAALMALKQAMAEQKSEQAATQAAEPKVEGRVSGHPKGYGFLRVDSLTSYFITPPQMKHCLPGDLVRARIVEDKPGSSNAVIEEIVEHGLLDFFGTVRVKSDSYFIVPESSSLKGWFYIPHSLRAGLVDGHVVKGVVTQHPFRNGKAQAKVGMIVGHESDKDLIWKLALARQAIARHDDMGGEPAKSIRPTSTVMHDLTSIPFVTIDGESTQDMDDAVFAEKHGNGWYLWVAISDVDGHLLPGSPVDLDAQQRAVTTYLPGMVVPMLPSQLSEGSLSLMKGVNRAVICAKMEIGRDGSLLSTEFCQATINSRAKLTYQAVSDYVSGQTDLLAAPEIKANVKNLYWMSKALNNWRENHALVTADSSDYRLAVADYQVASVTQEERNEAMKIIEECMVVANRAFAELMRDAQVPFVCRRQDGFTADALPRISAIARHLGIEVTDETLQTPAKINEVLRAVNASGRLDLQLATRSTLSSSFYDCENGHHAGLGLAIYGTWTSPIRKYADLINHRQLKAFWLGGDQAKAIDATLMEQINLSNRGASKAEREVANRLYCKHLEFRVGELLDGQVVSIRQNGIDVEIKGVGARVFVHKRTFSAPDDLVTNNDMGTECLVNGQLHVSLGQGVQVRLDPKDLQEGQLIATLK